MNDNSGCYFHPDEVVVGVCRLCLNERLLVLAAKQKNGRGGGVGHHHVPLYDHPSTGSGYYGSQFQGPPVDKKKKMKKKKKQQQQQPTAPATNLPRIFALGSFFNRSELRHWKPDDVNLYHDASSSPEDSYISIRFEDNCHGSWEKNVASKVSSENRKPSWDLGLSKSMKERDLCNKEYRHQHGAPGSGRETKTVIEHPKPRASLRWRRRIGHLFHLIRWKRSSKGNISHVDGVKVRNGWMRTLTRRRTKE
ncbi:hypothetical protein MLD38_022455 [Melastoma candidum]|uniref:Uncharacterized protein n=1 Tax=Melastoma candidum TaxID=119954 RepID=A0ACB9QKH5_9MYRT|nr:hypothetical protein MLD38_022455 [Melastoma candidum]